MTKKMDRAKEAIMGTAKQAGQVVRARTGIFRTLAKEHGEIAALMGSIAKSHADDLTRRRELFGDFKIALLAHARTEDDVFYRTLATYPELRADIQDARKDHQEIEIFLDELTRMDMSTNAWMTTFKQLKRTVEEHVDKEEGEVFAKATDVLSRDDTKAMRSRYEAKKQSSGAMHP